MCTSSKEYYRVETTGILSLGSCGCCIAVDCIDASNWCTKCLQFVEIVLGHTCFVVKKTDSISKLSVHVVAHLLRVTLKQILPVVVRNVAIMQSKEKLTESFSGYFCSSLSEDLF